MSTHANITAALTAAHNLVTQINSPGREARRDRLSEAIDDVAAEDSAMGVLLSAAALLACDTTPSASGWFVELNQSVTRYGLDHFASDPTQWDEPEETLTGDAAKAEARTTLQMAGVDVEAFERRMRYPGMQAEDGSNAACGCANNGACCGTPIPD